jgi:ribosomal protein L44E
MTRQEVADDLPTARTRLAARYVRVMVFCKSCQHRADADLQALIDAGQGDVPLIHLRFRCARCGTANTDFVVTAKPGV